MSVASVLAVVLIGVVALFQCLLALGVPWGAAAWGGGHRGVLPSKLRMASAASAIVLVAMAWFVSAMSASKNDVAIDVSPPPGLNTVLWAIAGYFGLGAIVNAISRSRVERIWAPVSLAIAVVVAIVAAAPM